MKRGERDRCYVLLDSDGLTELLHIRARKKPSIKTAKALLDLFRVVRLAMASKELQSVTPSSLTPSPVTQPQESTTNSSTIVTQARST